MRGGEEDKEEWGTLYLFQHPKPPGSALCLHIRLAHPSLAPVILLWMTDNVGIIRRIHLSLEVLIRCRSESLGNNYK